MLEHSTRAARATHLIYRVDACVDWPSFSGYLKLQLEKGLWQANMDFSFHLWRSRI